MPSPRHRLINPKSGNEVFAFVPEMAKFHFPQGPVVLLYGRRNFGACHIWDRHRTEMLGKGFLSQDMVPDFVASIVRPNAPLHYEGRHDAKLAVVQSASGTAILQLFQPQGAPVYYSVVTAYLGFNRHGQLIGRLK